MKLKVTKVDLEGIDERQVFDLLNEIRESVYDDFTFKSKYPQLKKLYQLLNGAFQTGKEGIHFLRGE